MMSNSLMRQYQLGIQLHSSQSLISLSGSPLDSASSNSIGDQSSVSDSPQISSAQSLASSAEKTPSA